MKKLMELEKAYEELEDGSQKQARMEAELRSNLEAALVILPDVFWSI